MAATDTQIARVATADTAYEVAHAYKRVLPTNNEIEAIAKIVAMKNNLNDLSPEDQEKFRLFYTAYYGLDLFSDAFVIADMRGTKKIQPQQSCFDQLRAKHRIKIEVTHEGWMEHPHFGHLYVVKVRATTPDGRVVAEDIGVKGCGKNDGLAEVGNTMMAAHTKAKNRVTKRIVPLGFPGYVDYGDDNPGDKTPIQTVTIQQRPALPMTPEQPAPTPITPAPTTGPTPPKTLKGKIKKITCGDMKLGPTERPQTWWVLAYGILNLIGLNPPPMIADEPTLQEFTRRIDEAEKDHLDTAPVARFTDAFDDWYTNPANHRDATSTFWTTEQVEAFLTETCELMRPSEVEQPQPMVEPQDELPPEGEAFTEAG